MKFILTIILVLSALLAQAQDKYLTIVRSDKAFDQVTYPPNTRFELKDAQGQIVFSDKSLMGNFEITEVYELSVYPNYKDEPDHFTLKTGQLQLNKAERLRVSRSSSDWGYMSSGVTVEKSLKPSQRNYGLQNVTLNFSNGVEFTYTDGDYKAVLNGKELEIKGKYLIYSPLGIHKVSFNPQNGKVYWVFEPRS
ncbi:hypothetical protein [Gilvibacter sp.]|uniref:hypothetical protein n=1 Tax=Gilvibacter sp. TaxID=2729997 RepID=UPI003F49C245